MRLEEVVGELYLTIVALGEGTPGIHSKKDDGAIV